MLTSVANGFVDKFGKIVGVRKETYSSATTKKVGKEMEKAHELYREMVHGCLVKDMEPDLSILNRIAPDLGIDKADIKQVFDEDSKLARNAIAAAKSFAKNDERIAEIYADHEATDEKSYFVTGNEEREQMTKRLKELNEEKAHYQRLVYFKAGHSVTISRGIKSQRSIFPGGREEIFEIAVVSDPEAQSKANTKG